MTAKAKNTSEGPPEGLLPTWEEVAEPEFDGFIVTGAPIALAVRGRSLLERNARIIDWTKTNVHPLLPLLGSAGGRGHFHRVPTTPEDKAFGVFRHQWPRLALPARLFGPPRDSGFAIEGHGAIRRGRTSKC